MNIAKDIRAKRAKLVEDARAIMSTENPSKEDMAKFDAMMDEVDTLKDQIDRVERADDLDKEMNARVENRARKAGKSTDEIESEDHEYAKAFDKYARFGNSEISADEARILTNKAAFRNALGEGVGGTGGYIVPTGFLRQLTEAQLQFGSMLTPGLCDILDTDSGINLPIPTENDTASLGYIVGESVPVNDQDATFGQTQLGAYMYTSGNQRMSLQLVQDSAFDLNAWAPRKLGIRIARALNNHLTTGTGTGQPMGVVTSATLGKTGLAGQTTSIIYDDLVDLEHSVDPAYRNNSKFMFHDTTLKVLKKLKDGYGRPLWLPGIAVKEPDTINGYSYVVNQSMPVMAANARSVLFGDFMNYKIRRVSGAIMKQLTERYADQAQIAFILWQRWDGRLIDAGTHPIAYYANSAT